MLEPVASGGTLLLVMRFPKDLAIASLTLRVDLTAFLLDVGGSRLILVQICVKMTAAQA